MEWFVEAKCATVPDEIKVLFIPATDERQGTDPRAVKVCGKGTADECPVLQECYNYGQQFAFGVYGGVDRVREQRKRHDAKRRGKR
jgi:hypothetical protein